MRPALFGEERTLVVLVGQHVCPQHTLEHTTFAPVRLGDLDAEFSGERAHSFGERQILLPHQEGERISTFPTSEAVPGSALRCHDEGRRLLVVEGAQAPPGAAGLLEADVSADQTDDVSPVPHSLESVLGDAAHSRPRAPR